MTKSEAIAIKNFLRKTAQDLQEVRMRLVLDTEGTVTLTEERMADSIERLEKALDSVQVVKNMAYAELDPVSQEFSS